MSGELCHSLGVCFVDKNFNIGHNLKTRVGRAFILHMCVPCDKIFHVIPYFLTLWFEVWATFEKKKPNLAHNFWTRKDRAFILQMCILCY